MYGFKAYQVGRLCQLSDGDPTFVRFADALKWVEAREEEDSKALLSRPFGLWSSQAEGSVLIGIFYEGAFYTSD